MRDNDASISYLLFGFVLIYFVYTALTTTPLQINESDSLDYHIPIAQNIARRNFTDLKSITQGLGFYPAVGETILALFILLHIPLGFYNVLALVILYIVANKLGLKSGLNKIELRIFSFSICILPSTIRLIPNQTVDIWLLIFFLVSLNLLLKIENKTIYFIKLGGCLGFLIGTKYSGILLAVALMVAFYRKKLLSFKLFYVLIPLIILGFSWYFRNYLVTGNPFYPVPLLGFIGNPNFRSQTWTGLKVLTTGRGVSLMSQAFISEFLIWSVGPLYLLYLGLIKKIKFNNLSVRLIVLSILTLMIFLLEPSWPNIQVTQSNMRFLLPAFACLILSIFLISKSLGNSHKLAIIAVVSSVGVLPLLNYYPKLIVISLIWFILISKLYEGISGGHSPK